MAPGDHNHDDNDYHDENDNNDYLDNNDYHDDNKYHDNNDYHDDAFYIGRSENITNSKVCKSGIHGTDLTDSQCSDKILNKY